MLQRMEVLPYLITHFFLLDDERVRSCISVLTISQTLPRNLHSGLIRTDQESVVLDLLSNHNLSELP